MIDFGESALKTHGIQRETMSETSEQKEVEVRERETDTPHTHTHTYRERGRKKENGSCKKADKNK